MLPILMLDTDPPALMMAGSLRAALVRGAEITGDGELWLSSGSETFPSTCCNGLWEKCVAKEESALESISESFS